MNVYQNPQLMVPVPQKDDTLLNGRDTTDHIIVLDSKYTINAVPIISPFIEDGTWAERNSKAGTNVNHCH